MKISFRNHKIERTCTDANYCCKVLSQKMQIKVFQCMAILRSAKNIKDIESFHINGCHKLKGDRKGQYAMNLVQPFRFVFSICDDSGTSALVIDFIDYH